MIERFTAMITAVVRDGSIALIALTRWLQRAGRVTWHRSLSRYLRVDYLAARLPVSPMDRRSLLGTIAVSTLLHAGLLAYVATTWGIVPSLLKEPEVQVMTMAPLPPPPPPPPPPEVTDIQIEKPRFRPRPVPPPPAPVKHVKPIPLKPQPPAESTADASTIVAEKPVPPDPPPVSNTPPRAASKPPPIYPERAIDANREGVVQVRITIQPSGMVSEAAVVSARPQGWFETAALSAVRRWRYESSGRISTTVVEIEFKLD
jgi:TonB family protein